MSVVTIQFITGQSHKQHKCTFYEVFDEANEMSIP